ncbi:MAG TPA: alanine racemase [Ilumatobacter sp.]|nr:alanine racemase [Ilumatobacter sp.]
MTIRLTVERERWWSHCTDIAATTPGLVPVVKGNGYGFGRVGLAVAAVELSPLIAVGTVHELAGLPAKAMPVVLTPAMAPPPAPAGGSTPPVLTIADPAHVHALGEWTGQVVVKLTSSMHRFGTSPDELLGLLATAQRAGLQPVGVALHLPLAGDDDLRRAEVEAWLQHVDPSLDVWVSHLAPDTYASLPATHRYKLRVGSYLWHGDRGALKLTADVLQTRPVTDGDTAGYRLTPVSGDGTLVMVGAGSAAGVAPLPDGSSPFHYRRRRLELVEPPHMHTSMMFVPAGQPVPTVGEWVDLQRPLTQTAVDELQWV